MVTKKPVPSPVSTPPVPTSWRDQLTDRERKEVEFAELYAADFNHGTDGHNRLNLISLMAKLLDNKELA